MGLLFSMKGDLRVITDQCSWSNWLVVLRGTTLAGARWPGVPFRSKGNMKKSLSLDSINYKNRVMDIQAEKYSLIEYITQVKDIRLIEKLKQFVKANEDDFWNDLTEDQKQELKQGMKELDDGQKHDYEQVMSKHRK